MQNLTTVSKYNFRGNIKNGDIINEALIYNDSAGIKQRLNIGTDFKDDITLSSLNDGEIYFGIQTIIKDLSGKIYIRVK